MTLRFRVERRSAPRGRGHGAAAILLLTAAAAAGGLAAAGCHPKPACNPDDAKGCVITKLRIRQEREPKVDGIDDDDVKERMATAESSFLVTRPVVDLLGEKGTLFFTYERLDRLVLERDLERIERYYRARGFYQARVRAARVLRTGESTVRVEIIVDEGPPTTLSKVALELEDPNEPLPRDPPSLGPAVADAKNHLQVGARLEEEELEEAKRRIVRAMTDRGYAYATVRARAEVDRATNTAAVTFHVRAGPPCTFGPIVIDGAGDLPMRPLHAAINIRPGRRFSTEAIDSAQIALADTGVLGSVTVEILRSEPGAKELRTSVPIRFVVQRTALRAIQVGGGAELGGRVETHLLSSWEHRNFLGDLRRFSIGARAGVVFYPLQLIDWDKDVKPLPDIRTEMDLRQPAFVEARTLGTARLEANLYRPLTANVLTDADTQNLFANFEVRGTAGVERPFWRSRVRLGASLNTQVITPVPIYEPVPPGFDPLVVPYAELRGSLDLRKGKDKRPDPINPHSGMYLGWAIQAAAIAPEGAADIRLQPDLRGFVPISDDVTLALRFTGGVLIPFGYGEPVFVPGTGCAAGDTACNDARARSLQILQLRGFFSGGVNSNRGYGYNGVNPQAIVRSLFSQGDETPVPIGGRYMWAASAELRFPIAGSFGASLFVDASDVWNQAPVGPHLSPGIGLRYMTPIGPARIDVAYRVPGLQHIGRDPCQAATLDEIREVVCQPLLFGQPIYAAIAIGHPF